MNIILEQDRAALCYFKHEITWPNFFELVKVVQKNDQPIRLI
jgi:hypothetical protein